MPARSIANIVIVGCFTAFCVGGLTFLAIGLGLNVPGLPGYHMVASFGACEGLVPQSDVAVSGVKVGGVDTITNDAQGRAQVRMTIAPEIRLRQDVRAVCRPKSLLGEKYIELVRQPNSSAPYIKDGYRLPPQQAGNSIEIDTVLNNLDPETRAAFSTNLRELGVAVNDRSSDINAVIPSLDQTVANFRPIADVSARRQAEIDRILSDLAVIMTALADEQDALGNVIDKGNITFGAIAERDQDLAGTIQQLDKLLSSLDLTFGDLTPADRAGLEKSPPTIASGQRLMDSLGPEIDRLLPELLLAQLNYPNNQLNVTHPEAVSLAREWMSAFASQDGTSHYFRFTNINENPKLPGLPGAPVLPGQSSSSPVPGSNAPGDRSQTPGQAPANTDLVGAIEFLMGSQPR